MNRIIKFRAWWKDAQMMVDILSLRDDGTIEFIVPVTCGKETWKEHQVLDEENQYELMQFTGLNDKNGKEIYEGDILSMDSWEPKNVQVKFIEGAFCLANGKGEYIGDIHYINHADRPQSTVIGNIYQNPELCP